MMYVLLCNCQREHTPTTGTLKTEKGGDEMTQTRQDIRQAWDKANLARYGVTLHNDKDKDLIDYVESQKRAGRKTSEIFKEGLESLKESGK